MKKIITSVMALTLGTSVAMAGGPVVVEDTAEVVAEPTSSIGVLPLLLGAIMIGAVLLNNDDDEEENN